MISDTNQQYSAMMCRNADSQKIHTCHTLPTILCRLSAKISSTIAGIDQQQDGTVQAGGELEGQFDVFEL